METLGIMHGKSGGGIKLYDEEGNKIKLAGKSLKISFTAYENKAYGSYELDLKSEVLPNFTDTSIYRYGIMIEHKGKCHYIGVGANGRNHYIMDLNKNINDLAFTQINDTPIITLSYVTGISYDNELHIFFSNLHYVWNEAEDTWTKIENLPFYITGPCQTVIYDDEINILGNAGTTYGHRRLNKETSTWTSITVPSAAQFTPWVGLAAAAATENGIYAIGRQFCRYTKSSGWTNITSNISYYPSGYPSDIPPAAVELWAEAIGNTIFTGRNTIKAICKTTDSAFNWTDTMNNFQLGTYTRNAPNYAFTYNRSIYTFALELNQDGTFDRTFRNLSIYHPKVYMQVQY